MILSTTETIPNREINQVKGWMLYFHPDLIRNTALGSKIDAYNFFNYEVHEALHLSENEQNTLNLSRTNSSNNQLNISQISINYPRQFNFGGQHCFPFNLQANPQKKLLKVDNFDGGPAANNNLFL